MRWGTAGRVAATVFAGLVAPVAVGAVGIAGAGGEIYTARDGTPPAPVDAAPAPVHDPARPTAVVVLGSQGANAADVLAPYEVLAATGAFNLYTAAAQRRPVPLTGGLDLVPDLSFGQLDEPLPATPDVIVVPQVVDPAGPGAAPIVEWLRRQRAQGDPLLLSVCVGAEVLASAGLLDGRPATSHGLGLIGLRRTYPAVRWPAYSPGGAASIQRSRPAPADAVALLRAGYRWDRPSMGVLLTDGVGEIELASTFRPYTELSYLARPVAVTTDGRPVRSRHGLTFAPRADLTTAAPGLDRLVVPGADAARHAAADGLSLPEGLTPVYLHHRPGFAFDAALGDMARIRDVATARWVAKTLQYPVANPQLSGPAWPWTLTLRPVLIAAAAAVLGVQYLYLRRSVHRGGNDALPQRP